MIGRRAFSSLLSAAVLGPSLAAWAQRVGKPWRVGFLSGMPPPADGSVVAPLRQALEAQGFVEGRDIVYEGRWASARVERLPTLVAELLALKVDVIVTTGGPAAMAARRATAATPLVVTNAGDVVETGLVASLARPGGNITGVNDPAAVLSAKRLEILKELVPAAQRVAVLWNAGDQAMTLRYREIEKAARLLRVAIEPLGVREPDDFDTALAAMSRSRPDALMMVSDSLTTLNRQRVVDYAAAHRIAAVYELGAVVKAGGLVSYGADPAESFTLAADYVGRLLRGARPGDLPVQQPNRYVLVINLKTARALGLAVPQALLLRADEVIE